jgi:hypothetical protein
MTTVSKALVPIMRRFPGPTVSWAAGYADVWAGVAAAPSLAAA